MDNKEAAYTILGIIQSEAPTGKEQEEVAVAYRQLQEVIGGNDRALLKTMVNTLADGLNYGNWPWNRGKHL